MQLMDIEKNKFLLFSSFKNAKIMDTVVNRAFGNLPGYVPSLIFDCCLVADTNPRDEREIIIFLQFLVVSWSPE